MYSVDLSEKNHTYKIISISKNKKLQMTLSPTGKHLAYLNTHNIYIIDIESETEMKITLDGKKTKKNGFAEYAAWMDLDRNTGYWWSPDGQYIAYIQTEEKGVKSYDVPGTGDKATDTVKMRLPFAGEANAEVSLRFVDVKTGEDHQLDIGNNQDIYIARVEWLPDGTKVAVQILSRDQYRNGVYAPTREVVGACMQVLHDRATLMRRYHELFTQSDGTLQCHDPQCIVIVGSSSELSTREHRESFELFRNGQRGLTLITFDEVIRRMEQLIDLLRGNVPILTVLAVQRETA